MTASCTSRITSFSGVGLTGTGPSKLCRTEAGIVCHTGPARNSAR